MKINFSQSITNLAGEPLKERDENLKETDKAITLSAICVNSLLAILPDAQGRPQVVTGQEKVKRFQLAQKINRGGEIELETEEIAKIKDMVGKVQNVLVTGQAFKMLEGKKEKD